jgi:bla regulator protein BlaR1
MPALFDFLLKVNIALLLFCAGYYLVLRPLTFYTLNRIYLLAAIVFASVYPFINLSGFAQRHEELVKPVLNWQMPAQKLVQPLSQPAYWHWAEAIFWLGAYVLAIRLAVQLFSLYRLYKSSKPAVIYDHQVRIMNKDAAPFSFWQSIFVNPANHDPADLKAILLHEQVHVSQWHTADILLAEISSVFYWFNPGIWFMKKAIRENVEFITDRKILNKGIDSKTYQYSLVSVSFSNTQPGIVNHFNISTIKKRIIMMNAKRSSRLNLTRYAFLLPVVITLLLVFSISKADFAKPIRIKLINAVKPLTSMVATAAIPDPTGGNIVFAKPKKIAHKTAKTSTGFKADTTKKSLIVVRNNNATDSAVCYINGVRGNLKSVDPDNMAQVTFIKGDRSSTDLPAYINIDDVKKTGVVLVVTKDSPKGKAIMKKSDSTSNSGTVLLTGSLNYKPLPKSSSIRPLRSIRPVKTSPNNAVTNGITINIDTTSKAPIKARIIRVTSASNVSVDGQSISSHDISVDNDKGMHVSFDKNKTPLVIVDGKEIPATDINKINPNTIESMNVLNDEKTEKKYGSKAKDGVILINTKRRPFKE